MYSSDICEKARNSRDHRFDGLFYVAVKTTGIYCRPICPAPTAKEKNVEYFEYAHNAAEAGFRPCIRCRPDAAPGSYAWLGTETTAVRAKKLIDEGVLSTHSVAGLAERLGITQRYLNKLFKQFYGTSPKQYALYRQCDFAKQLLQQTTLPVAHIAFASGFHSLRRFNDAFVRLYQLTPSKLRGGVEHTQSIITLNLPFRPPYNWQVLHDFLAKRLIEPVEWLTDNGYGRSFSLETFNGSFAVHFDKVNHCFRVEIAINDVTGLRTVVSNIRRVLDLDANTSFIETHLSQALPKSFILTSGLRLPGIWSEFEAGVRAILGQQVSVGAARNLLKQLVQELGEQNHLGQTLFPNPDAMKDNAFAFFKMPQRRKEALASFARYCSDENVIDDLDLWLDIKGVGPWTVDYAKMRGQSNPDIYLAGDLGVKKAFAKYGELDINTCAPFRSYLTFQLWQQL
ncbi:putative bifunctional transcriptional activator/DNA repair enzyme AlkA [Pseudoalteromonas holothuriae]|uniref:DNA-3-methyladenine glycosylase II n=1 Tax=Pseudoalteromonas holothuriae TaxID=2963714 RepID=A0A9W4QZJ3_9GAMM|nr:MULTISPECIES: AlkA N-terminal domain-containing protein [unclassified Pseudoalteromonas]CAH9050553.1 putative bifunctional transcriptional activator/DNA repair enzyme AlkA [Pseudoalteromonas sp. CIP111951]CAH9061218.1 putative bifunctional transcriptional activator/DNA repair enzyme AlkA [Pseudoalteromonas sp. CIP111854]